MAGTKYISLSGERGKNKKTIVDADDYQRFAKQKWYLSTQGYAISAGGKGKNKRLHRLITDCPDGMVVDHLNGNLLDNRKKNLRVCTQAENMKNIHSVKGYSYDKSKGNYIVRYKGKYCGRCTSKESAERIYKLAKSGNIKVRFRRKYSVLPKHISKQYGKYVVGIVVNSQRYRKVAIPTLKEALEIRNYYYQKLGMGG